jgi:Sec-independent protein translocase protein TatA
MPDLLLLLIIGLVIVFVVRGPKTLPKWGAALGKGYRDAKTEAVKAQGEIQARASGTKDPTDSSGDQPT